MARGFRNSKSAPSTPRAPRLFTLKGCQLSLVLFHSQELSLWSSTLLALSSSLNCPASQPSPSRVNYKAGCPRAIILRRGGQATGKGDAKFPGISAQRKPMLSQEALGSWTGAEAVQVTGQTRVSLSHSSFASSLEQCPEYLSQRALSSCYVTYYKQELARALLGSCTPLREPSCGSGTVGVTLPDEPYICACLEGGWAWTMLGTIYPCELFVWE